MNFQADFGKARKCRQSGDWQGYVAQSNGKTCRKDICNILLVQVQKIKENAK